MKYVRGQHVEITAYDNIITIPYGSVCKITEVNNDPDAYFVIKVEFEDTEEWISDMCFGVIGDDVVCEEGQYVCITDGEVTGVPDYSLAKVLKVDTADPWYPIYVSVGDVKFWTDADSFAFPRSELNCCEEGDTQTDFKLGDKVRLREKWQDLPEVGYAELGCEDLDVESIFLVYKESFGPWVWVILPDGSRAQLASTIFQPAAVSLASAEDSLIRDNHILEEEIETLRNELKSLEDKLTEKVKTYRNNSSTIREATGVYFTKYL